MKGLAQAEWLRFRKRRILLLVVFAAPLLAGFMFLAGYASTANFVTPFDPEEVRARIIAEGYLAGLSPAEAEAAIAQTIEDERGYHEQALEQQAIARARFGFPQSVVMLLSNGTFVFVALVLLTALSIGDEFGWGTVRTALLASSRRRQQLLVRVGALGLVAVVMLALLVLLGAILPVVLAATVGAPLRSTQAIDPIAVLALLLGQLLISIMVIAFAALVTLVIRSGSLTLVVVLVYVLVETAMIGLLARLEAFQYDGVYVWLLDAFPLRATLTLSDITARATGGLGDPSEVIDRNLRAAGVPFIALLLWAVLFAILAFRRFSRMDIVE